MHIGYSIIFFVIFSPFCENIYASGLTLERYLEEVRHGNLEYQAAIDKSDGAVGRFSQGSLIFSPSAFGEFSWTDDRSLLLQLANLGTRNKIEELSTGFSMLTRFGLLGKVSYNIQRTELFGAPATFDPNNKFFFTFIALEFFQPLWQDLFGKQSKLQEIATGKGAHATYSNEKYNSIVTLVTAEKAYWTLVAARELVIIHKESFDRATKLKEWQGKRVTQRLSDDSDLIQATAALKLRELDYKTAIINLEIAERTLNEFRGTSDKTVNETVMFPDLNSILERPLPEFRGAKLDVEAARYNVEVSRANLEIARDKQLPSFSFYGSAALKARDENLQIATGDVIGTEYPVIKLGANLTIPLDFKTASDVKSGYLREIIGTEKLYQRKLYEQEFQREDLIKRIIENRERLKILVELESAQKIKLDTERKRHKQGRSTTYQVSLFEQDYLSAQINKVNAVYQFLVLYAEAKKFQSEES